MLLFIKDIPFQAILYYLRFFLHIHFFFISFEFLLSMNSYGRIAYQHENDELRACKRLD